jgi:NADH-quinone oxidoreductase subunit C
MQAEAVFKALREKFGDAVSDPVVDTPDKPAFDAYVFVDVAKIFDVCAFLRTDPAMKFEHLSAIAGTDMKDAIHVAYVLQSYTHKAQLIIKVKLDRDNPACPSVEQVWKAATWHERETYDLVGVTFTGHGDLRRLLLPDDWKGHPLRKDYTEEADYHGMPTTRPNPLGKV